MKVTMKHFKKILLLVVLCLGTASLLGGCKEQYPDKTADGLEWNKEWTILGSTLGVDETNNDFTLSENPVVLSGSDIHYATWTYGEASTYINEDEEETDLYPAEIYLLVNGTEDAATAESTLSEWIEKEKEAYDAEDFSEITCNEQTYTLMTYTISKAENPYSHGATAFAIYGNNCITAELCATEDFEGDTSEILVSFLNRCHYNATQNDK